jgi:hypothetical protein
VACNEVLSGALSAVAHHRVRPRPGDGLLVPWTWSAANALVTLGLVRLVLRHVSICWWPAPWRRAAPAVVAGLLVWHAPDGPAAGIASLVPGRPLDAEERGTRALTVAADARQPTARRRAGPHPGV